MITYVNEREFDLDRKYQVMKPTASDHQLNPKHPPLRSDSLMFLWNSLLVLFSMRIFWYPWLMYSDWCQVYLQMMTIVPTMLCRLLPHHAFPQPLSPPLTIGSVVIQLTSSIGHCSSRSPAQYRHHKIKTFAQFESQQKKLYYTKVKQKDN